MLIVYRPALGSEQTWEYKPQKMLNAEAAAIEKVTGWTYEEFGEKFMSGSVIAKQALLWVLRKRTEPTLRYNDVEFAVDELEHELDDDEKRKVIERLDSSDLSAEDKAAYREALGLDSEPVEEPDGDPKASDPPPPPESG